MYKVTEEKLKRAIKFLKKDIYDDWYCDLQNYSDLFSDIPKLIEQINHRIQAGHGVFVAQKAVLLNIPKGNGGFRYTLELSPLDRIAFHIFGLELISLLDKSISFRVLSQRKSADEETLFKPAIEQWNKFENYTRVSGVGKYIIETDLSNYFENIQVDRLRDELVSAAAQAKLSSDDFLRCMYLIESTISILKAISFDGKRGLPQNRDVSHFLANIYMRHLDSRMTGRTYFRYVDDIRIIAESRAEANLLMLNLVECLREFGLAINSGKTRILIPGSAEHESFINDFDFEAKKVEAMLNSGKRKFVNESFQEIFRATKMLLDENKIHERRFRFYANRLITFLNAKDVTVPQKYRDEIAERLIGGIEAHPDCAAQICALVQALGPNKKLQSSLVDWATDSDNLTFEWAVYTVIKTLAEQKFKSVKLQAFCRTVLSRQDFSDPITGIAAVFINVRAASRIETRVSQDNTHFLQRHLLIALSLSHPQLLKKKNTGKRIHEEYLGQHYRLHKASKAPGYALVRRTERVTQRILIKELRNYA